MCNSAFLNQNSPKFEIRQFEKLCLPPNLLAEALFFDFEIVELWMVDFWDI